MSAKIKPTGSKSMKANGYVQVSVYLKKKDADRVDRIADRERRKRAAVVLGFVLDALDREGKA